VNVSTPELCNSTSRKVESFDADIFEQMPQTPEFRATAGASVIPAPHRYQVDTFAVALLQCAETQDTVRDLHACKHSKSKVQVTCVHALYSGTDIKTFGAIQIYNV